MALSNDNVTDQALSLPADARLKLVEKLLISLNPPVDSEMNRLWAKEAEKRVVEIKEGKAAQIPGDQVFCRIVEKYGK